MLGCKLKNLENYFLVLGAFDSTTRHLGVKINIMSQTVIIHTSAVKSIVILNTSLYSGYFLCEFLLQCE